ncbi:16S rRNA (uracil(1498)-N(3))-methyltransferase [Canibacter zhoujuaniae]|uniref:16S rRNA (uracil(1498)-N(3))-methyltransferase n=1 Tax=Canibacter zhoujuaniae TaxID=2708343 RepID=UPI001423179E|nr:16S rRNA (uracil(1498)-N(3))-methyltransferase [Canibacter zhoujuaniae]
MAHLYYDPAVAGAQVGDTLIVRGTEAHHAVTVSRLRQGEEIMLGDGVSTLVTATVTAITTGREASFTATVSEVRNQQGLEVELVLVQALAKQGRDERAVEQSTEFGVSTVIPWQAERSVSRWEGSQKIQRGVEKWQKIAREAAKQSLRSRIPAVQQPVDAKAIAAWAADSQNLVLILHPWASEKLSTVVREVAEDSLALGELQRIYLIVGPEGGISDFEIDLLLGSGATSVRLGEEVLRTSSAGAAALAVIQTSLGRW